MPAVAGVIYDLASFPFELDSATRVIATLETSATGAGLRRHVGDAASLQQVTHSPDCEASLSWKHGHLLLGLPPSRNGGSRHGFTPNHATRVHPHECGRLRFFNLGGMWPT